MHAEDGKETFPPRSRLRTIEKQTLISSLFRTNLFFLLVFVTHMFHQEAFFSANAAEAASFSYRLAGKMVRKNGTTPIRWVKVTFLPNVEC
jgi:hypothetical protein